ncbi:MAG: transposase [Pseudomonadales bacterium]|nr:transposase [Pseudomonadales bacterium]
MLILARVVLRQANRALNKIKVEAKTTPKSEKWIDDVEHFRSLMLQVIYQTHSRVIDGISVPASEKIVSIFEEHTDVIVKGFRDTHYGHKVNLSTEENGFITYFSIEDGNPADKDLFLPVIKMHEDKYNRLPTSVVCDGGYASKKNVSDGRSLGLKHAVFL